MTGPAGESPESHRAASRLWPIVALILGLAILFAGTGIYLFHSLRQMPAELAAGSKALIGEAKELAAAFHQGTVTHLFVSYATSVEGTSRLQVATLKQTESWELRDEASTFWGTLELPAVAVRATAPVETTYFVDLDGEWSFELEGNRVVAMAPPLRFNKPAIDASKIRYEIRQGSLIRDEDRVLQQLKRELTGRSAIRAKQNLPLVHDTARKQVEGFVRTWLLSTFDDAEAYRVEVIFEDEAPAAPRIANPELRNP